MGQAVENDRGVHVFETPFPRELATSLTVAEPDHNIAHERGGLAHDTSIERADQQAALPQACTAWRRHVRRRRVWPRRAPREHPCRASHIAAGRDGTTSGGRLRCGWRD